MPAIIHKKQIIGQATNTVDLIKDTVGWTCKNKLKITGASTTIDGVTFTVNSDGTVSTSGTAVNNCAFILNSRLLLSQGEEYILTGCPANGSVGTYSIRLRNPSSGILVGGDTGEGYKFVNSSDMGFAIYIGAGTNTTGLVFSPMVRKSTVTDSTFEPYHITVEEALDIIASGSTGVTLPSILLSSGWDENGVYSFEDIYPFDSYNIEIEPDGDRLSKSQFTAWGKAGVVGSLTSNSCKAMNSVPDEDIPIIIKITRKE